MRAEDGIADRTGRFKVLLPRAIVPSAPGPLYTHWKTPPASIVRLLPISAAEAWLASGRSTPPLLTVTGTRMAPAGPPASVAPELTCTLAPAALLESVLLTCERSHALTFTVGAGRPVSDRRAAEDHAAVVAAVLPTLTVVAEIDSAGKVNVMPLAALMFWTPPVPARTSDGTLPVPASQHDRGVGRGRHVAAERHAAAARHVLQRQVAAAGSARRA